jgi:polyisoprenoid-binding protein YceI
MLSRLLPSFLIAALFLAAPLSSKTLKFELDPVDTEVEFGFAATFHKVNGRLAAKQGTIEIDLETGAATGWILLDATTATTANRRRDRIMHEKILESLRFPDIVFSIDRVSGGVRPVGRSELQLHGTLDLHGNKHPFSLLAVANSDGQRVTATGSVVVPYLEWGLRDPSFFLLRVAKVVTVRIRAVGRVVSAP